MMDVQEVAISLRQHGFKVTPQRLAVYEGLARLMGSHPAAGEIYRALREDYPTMSLATVYKALEALCAAGLVRRLQVGEEAVRYDADIRSHSHVYCCACGRVEDFSLASEAQLMREAGALTGYEIQFQQICFHGLCPDCRGKAKA